MPKSKHLVDKYHTIRSNLTLIFFNRLSLGIAKVNSIQPIILWVFLSYANLHILRKSK
jgi:hypothetical protein